MEQIQKGTSSAQTQTAVETAKAEFETIKATSTTC